jgi:prepilin-type N-terminal cleavage/methylation domain-containing protein
MLKKLKNQRQSGFTIIEVMIVLAIAGLIMLVVLVVVPQLNRNSRDSRRQQVAQRLRTELETYANSNDGRFPFTGGAQTCSTTAGVTGNTAGSCNDFMGRYVNNGKIDINDPSSGSPVGVTVVLASTTQTTNDGARPGATGTWTPGNIVIFAGGRCSGETVTATAAGTANSREVALVIAKDRQNTWQCI